MYFIANIANETNFKGMQRATVEFVRFLPKLQELYFQANRTSSNFNEFVNNQVYEMGSQTTWDTIVELIAGDSFLSNKTERNITFLSMTDSCLTKKNLSDINVLSSDLMENKNIQIDIFVYTYSGSCSDKFLERDLACSRNGEWRRIKSDSYMQMPNDIDGSSVRDLVESYLRFYPTNFYSSGGETVLWREAGIEESSGNENQTIAACMAVPRCGMFDAGECGRGEDEGLLGIVCMEFDRERVNLLEESEMVSRPLKNKTIFLCTYSVRGCPL